MEIQVNYRNLILHKDFESQLHLDAIGIQNPYEELNYDNLPESP